MGAQGYGGVSESRNPDEAWLRAGPAYMLLALSGSPWNIQSLRPLEDPDMTPPSVEGNLTGGWWGCEREIQFYVRFWRFSKVFSRAHRSTCRPGSPREGPRAGSKSQSTERLV